MEDLIYIIDWVKAHNQWLGWLCIHAKFCSSLHFTINIKYIFSELLNIFVYSSKYTWKNWNIVQGANSDLLELSSPRLSSSSTFFPAGPSLSLLPLGRENIMNIEYACTFSKMYKTIYHIVQGVYKTEFYRIEHFQICHKYHKYFQLEAGRISKSSIC